MSSKPRRVPSYRLHKASGLARTIINGQHIYLGRFGTPESWEKYNRLIVQWLGDGQQATGQLLRSTGNPPSNNGISINQLILSYWQFAQGYYRKNGRLTGETDNIRAALRPLRKLYGGTFASQFGPDSLEIVRESMIQSGLSRNVINARVSRIKRMFRWASKKRLVPPETYHGLSALEGLKFGRSRARETERVKSVPEEHVVSVLPHVTPQIRAMIRVQELTAMRPQDIRNMRTCDLDMSADVWVYTPWTHKTEHLGHERRVAIGARAQAILKDFLKPDEPTAYVFYPKEAVAAQNAERRRRRKTPLTPSQLRRKRKRNPKKEPGEQYAKSSYETAIARACKKANVPNWSPNRLRHNCGAKVRRQFGIEAEAAVLGNSLGMVAEVYSESNFQKAVEVMREIG